jgi:hypothetical protein
MKTDADLAATAQVAAANLEAQYSDQHLERLVKQKGFEDVTSIDPAQHPA